MGPKRKSTQPVAAEATRAKTQRLLPGIETSIDLSHWDVKDNLLVYKNPAVVSTSQILGLDIDNTVITPASGRRFAKDANDWMFLYPTIPKTLKEYVNRGYKIVFLSNQKGISAGFTTVKELQKKISDIVARLGVPIQGYFSLVEDKFRKPMTGMWEELEKSGNDGVVVDRTKSLYCGDAAGRPAEKPRPKDHSCADRLFALNLEVPFMTPEELWLGKPSTVPFSLPPFDPTTVVKSTTPPAMPKLVKPKCAEVVVVVGFPASGKSYFSKHYLGPLGYMVVSRDVLGTWQKCVDVADKELTKGNPVAIDNTNMDLESRSRFINLAKKHGCPVRCYHLQTTFDHARHNERYRQLTDSNHSKISQMVFNMMRAKYAPPTASEGYVEIVEIPFVFDKAACETVYYCMHLLEK